MQLDGIYIMVNLIDNFPDNLQSLWQVAGQVFLVSNVW